MISDRAGAAHSLTGRHRVCQRRHLLTRWLWHIISQMPPVASVGVAVQGESAREAYVRVPRNVRYKGELCQELPYPRDRSYGSGSRRVSHALAFSGGLLARCAGLTRAISGHMVNPGALGFVCPGGIGNVGNTAPV